MVHVRYTILAAACLLAGCGGGGGPAPALGSGLVEHIRVVDLDPSSPQVSVQAGPLGYAVGTVGPLQSTAYVSESGGTSQIRFFDSSATLATYTGSIQDSTYVTIALYPTAAGYSTFGLVDNTAAVSPSQTEIRIANAASLAGGDIDVYLSPGSHTAPVTESQYLITPNGLPFGNGTIYEIRAPGTFTVTVVSGLDTADLLLNQVVTLNAGQAITLYVANQNTSVTTIDNG